MASVSIVNRSSRTRLKSRRDPYWHMIAPSQHIGYRKGTQGGTWVARYNSPDSGRLFEALGQADDTIEADGQHVLSFSQAAEAAGKAIARMSRSAVSGVRRTRYTVEDAAKAWLETQRDPTGASHVRNSILPTLSSVPLMKLTKAMLYNWHRAEGAKPTIRSQMPNSKVPCDMSDPEVRRKRQDTADRVLRSLRGILSLAMKQGHIESNAAWINIEEFKVSRQRTEFLTVAESNRLVEACEPDFRKVVHAALYPGCRYDELCRLKVEAYDAQNRMLSVMQTKTDKIKNIYLTDAEAEFFAKQVDGRERNDSMFVREDGCPWAKDHQTPRMKNALTKAGIEKDITFHNLRHTFASQLAMSGMQAEVIQLQLGHASPRMTQRYTHLSPDYVAASVRARKPEYQASN